MPPILMHAERTIRVRFLVYNVSYQ